jgi:hypothetical protein
MAASSASSAHYADVTFDALLARDQDLIIRTPGNPGFD